MKAVFVELPAFERHRAGYLDDGAFARLQQTLMASPEVGDVIEGTGVCESFVSRMYGAARENAEACG